MADGIKIAKGRISFFEAEIDRLKEYIRQSEKLFTEGWLGPVETAAAASVAAKPSGHTSLDEELRRSASRSDDADDDEELSLTRAENAAAAGMGNGAGVDRKDLFRRAAS